MKQVDKFISRISTVEKRSNATNLYFGDSRESKIRRGNLKVYLTKMKDINPNVLFLGEAPGYKGCRLSGIPFTSERIMFENSFFRHEPVKFISSNDSLEIEISATIVWDQISKFEIQPLIWNIFPFHPHSANDTKTNRTPTRAELEEGKIFLNDILTLFDIKRIIALGRKAESQLSEIGLPFLYIRHPANGGKKHFVNGLNTQLELRKNSL